MPRYLICAALSFALNVLPCTPAGADDGHVPRSELVAMGLGQLEIMSDVEGRQIRGLFVAKGDAGSGFFITDVNPNALLHNKNSEGMPGRVVHHSSVSTSAVIVYHPKGGMKFTGK